MLGVWLSVHCGPISTPRKRQRHKCASQLPSLVLFLATLALTALTQHAISSRFMLRSDMGLTSMGLGSICVTLLAYKHVVRHFDDPSMLHLVRSAHAELEGLNWGTYCQGPCLYPFPLG